MKNQPPGPPAMVSWFLPVGTIFQTNSKHCRLAREQKRMPPRRCGNLHIPPSVSTNFMKTTRPNNSEVQFLTLAYNRFYDLYEEVMNDNFWDKNEWERFSKIKQAFSIYAELLNYEPLKWVIEKLKTARPPMESEIGSELFKFVRNVVAHFPFFKCWDEVWINNSLVNWYKEGQTIDKFLKKYEGHKEVKYRFWEPSKKKMTYLTISFPNEYLNDSKVFLKDIISEKEGVKFSFILMRQIMNTQVEEINCKPI